MPTTDPLEGGLLDRLVEEATHSLVRDSLTALGWFSLAPEHPPLNLIAGPRKLGETIQPNTLIVEVENVSADGWELGRELPSLDGLLAYCDLYSPNQEMGKHLAGDVRAILQGGLPSIGRTRNTVPIMDLTIATPDQIGYARFVDVRTERERVYDQPWEGLLFSTQFRILYGRI